MGVKVLINIDIRVMTVDDIKSWASFAHEISDNIIEELISDISVFYEGFDAYMEAKVKKQEAYMAFDKYSMECVGVIAFSKKNNKITFLGVSDRADYELVGSKLMNIALQSLDCTKEISANVLIGEYEPLKKEKCLYEKYGFVKSDDATSEASIPAYLMRRYPTTF